MATYHHKIIKQILVIESFVKFIALQCKPVSLIKVLCAQANMRFPKKLRFR